MSGILTVMGTGKSFPQIPTILDTAGVVSTVAGPSVTFSGMSIGTASSNRRIFVFVGTRIEGTVAPTITGVTVGGLSATLITSYSLTGRTSGPRMGVYVVDVPTGTTANVVISTSSSNSVQTYFFVSLFGGSTDDSYTSTFTAGQTDSDSASLSFLTGNPPGNAVVIAAVMHSKTELGSMTVGGGSGSVVDSDALVVSGVSFGASLVVGVISNYWQYPLRYGYSFQPDGVAGYVACVIYARDGTV